MSDLIAVNGAVKVTAPPTLAKNSDIQITIKRTEHHVEIDMDKLTWKDAKLLRKQRAAIADGSMSEDEALELADKLIAKVTGQDPEEMPMEVVNRVMEVLFGSDAEATATEGN